MENKIQKVTVSKVNDLEVIKTKILKKLPKPLNLNCSNELKAKREQFNKALTMCINVIKSVK
jgi:hypothetical protein